MYKELPVGESGDQLRGDDAFFPFYHSKRELTGRLMLEAEKSVPEDFLSLSC